MGLAHHRGQRVPLARRLAGEGGVGEWLRCRADLVLLTTTPTGLVVVWLLLLWHCRVVVAMEAQLRVGLARVGGL